MENPESFLKDEIGEIFTVKPSSIGPPTQYLGNKVSQVELDSVKCWSFSSSQNVKSAVKNVEEHLLHIGHEKLKPKTRSPWPELTPKEVSHYQSLIGILR